MLRQFRVGLTEQLTHWVAEYGSAEKLSQGLAGIQRKRRQVEELQGALLHFWLLPSRQDVKELRRKLLRLRRRSQRLSEQLEELEKRLSEDS